MTRENSLLRKKDRAWGKEVEKLKESVRKAKEIIKEKDGVIDGMLNKDHSKAKSGNIQLNSTATNHISSEVYYQ